MDARIKVAAELFGVVVKSIPPADDALQVTIRLRDSADGEPADYVHPHLSVDAAADLVREAVIKHDGVPILIQHGPDNAEDLSTEPDILREVRRAIDERLIVIAALCPKCRRAHHPTVPCATKAS